MAKTGSSHSSTDSDEDDNSDDNFLAQVNGHILPTQNTQKRREDTQLDSDTSGDISDIMSY